MVVPVVDYVVLWLLLGAASAVWSAKVVFGIPSRLIVMVHKVVDVTW